MKPAVPIVVVAVAVLAVVAGCGGGGAGGRIAIAGADASRAPAAFRTYGCGACHSIPGIDGADADVGPPLDDLAGRVNIAGSLSNTPENLIRWIRFPQRIDPGSVMPDMGVTQQDAADIAAYLYDH
jgi:cytochrome c2